jgi:hypothetical protein
VKRLLRPLVATIAFVLFLGIGGCSQPDKNLIYGTWTSESGPIQKSVHTPDGMVRNYTHLSDSAPVEEAKDEIVKCWSDSQGNVWCTSQGTIIVGPHKNTVPRIQTLTKISQSGAFLETMVRGVVEFNPKSFPTKIDPSDPYLYMSFHRAKE